MRATTPFPPLPLLAPSGKLSGPTQTAVLEVEMRQLPVLTLQLKDSKQLPLLAHFPILLYPIRVAYLAPATQAALRVDAKRDLLIEARAPELLGDTPLAHWSLNAQEVEALAHANATGGTLLVEVKGKKNEIVRRVLPTYWLDWQGWSGFARHLARAAQVTDATTLRSLAYELGQRREPPTGILTAQAYLYTALDDAAAAAEACQAEIELHLDHEGLPSEGALEALVLLGRLLHAYDETTEARAALSLALRINPNHHEANAEIIKFLTDEEDMIATLARLAALPQRPPAYSSLVEQSAHRLGSDPTVLQKQVDGYVKSSGAGLWGQRPLWLNQSAPAQWLRALHF